MENYLISEINTIITYYTSYPDQPSILKNLNKLNLNIAVIDVPTHILKRNIDYTLKEFQIKLESKIKYKTEVFYIGENSKIIRTLVFLKSTNILQIDFSTKRIKNPTTYIFVIWIVTTAVLFGLISLLFMKNQVKSIVKLTQAAKEFGKGRKHNFIPCGANEIRSLGISFLKMRKNVEKQIKYRTQLLAYIAHELRTPITRIKLKLALLKKSQATESINNNIDKIEDMVKSYLDFAKQEGNEETKKCDLVKIINDIISSFNDKRIVFHSKVKDKQMLLRSNSIERALNNILDNSLKYALKTIDVNLLVEDKNITIQIDDDGSGINEENYNAAFEPFNKLNSSHEEGYGLGLDIASSIIKAHGGKISLAKSPYNGLRVIITLPK
jgi:two-component system osmolarity sensor histidine kinase EnvZ